MNLFEDGYIRLLMLAAFYCTIIVSAVNTVFEKFFEPENRRKLLTVIVAIVVSVLVTDFSILTSLNWQVFVTNLLLTIAFAILFYSYLGAKYITVLFTKIKKMLPG